MEKIALASMLLVLTTLKMSAQIADPEVDSKFQFFIYEFGQLNQKHIFPLSVAGGEAFITIYSKLRATEQTLQDDPDSKKCLNEEITPFQIIEMRLWYEYYRNRISKSLLDDISLINSDIAIELSTTPTPDSLKIQAENSYLIRRLRNRGIFPDIVGIQGRQDSVCHISPLVFNYFKSALEPLQQKFDKIKIHDFDWYNPIEVSKRCWYKDMSINVTYDDLEIVFVTAVLSDKATLYQPHTDILKREDFDFIKDWMVEGLCDVKYSAIIRLIEYFKSHKDITSKDIEHLQKDIIQ